MKKVVVACISLFFLFSLNAQKADTKKFVSQYSKQEGFTVVSLGNGAMKLLSVISKFVISSEEEAQFISNTESIRIVSSSANLSKEKIEAFVSDVLLFCETNEYESFIEVEEFDNSVNIFYSANNDGITGLTILNVSSENDNSVDAIFITGKFSFEDLSKIASENKIYSGR